MKRIITDVYNFAYKITKAKMFSVIFALVSVTALNFIIIYGVVILVDDWLPTGSIFMIFVFPYSLVTALILLLINFYIMSPAKKLGTLLKNKSSTIPPIIIYTGIAILLFLYIYYIKRF